MLFSFCIFKKKKIINSIHCYHIAINVILQLSTSYAQQKPIFLYILFFSLLSSLFPVENPYANCFQIEKNWLYHHFVFFAAVNKLVYGSASKTKKNNIILWPKQIVFFPFWSSEVWRKKKNIENEWNLLPLFITQIIWILHINRFSCQFLSHLPSVHFIRRKKKNNKTKQTKLKK